MSRTRWAVLLVLYVLVSLAIPVMGYSLPPCLGNADGQVSADCIARWEAAMPVFPDRFVYLLGVPMSAVVTLIALIGITLVFDVARRALRSSSSDTRVNS